MTTNKYKLAMKNVEETNEYQQYFKSDAHMLAYALLHLDGKIRMKMLKIKKIMYHSQDSALEWCEDIANRLECLDNEVIRTLAFYELNQLYLNMVGDD